MKDANVMRLENLALYGMCVQWVDDLVLYKNEKHLKNESTEVLTLGAIRIQLYHQCFEQV